MTFYGEVGETVDAGWILDARLLRATSLQTTRISSSARRSAPAREAARNGQKPIRHVKETMDYSKANYNALEPECFRSAADGADHQRHGAEPVADRGGAAQAVHRRADDVADEGGTKTAPNALVLTAATDAQANVWHFGGETL